MSSVELGNPVPDFEVQATGNQTIRLSDFQGKNVILYFYPKDNTPGCTTEGQDFRDRMSAFAELNTEILGVSRDGLRAHENFRAKHDFPFHLISDKDETLCKLFDVIKLKKLYGKEYLGIDRSTFLIDGAGVLRKAWRSVKVKGHADEVLEATKAL
ncbi:peroxiredoxin [Marinobacter salinisoli]|uniref:thioredoxin-dependent peroxiredoxin n=1 Tax=Marinobacter salinisoli TaxID=2769486 RepID=A0ABX7MTS3_9GAMM|nr:peroxiredoxin [Marinobacter salinisoli]QSP93648.1 peroxiredoxin [Marinobacter salinisoli]